MNRRVSIKYAFGIGMASVFSFSTYKWFSLHKDVELKSLSDYKLLISELAETIIPETDTPGARKAGVEHYIINVLANCCTKLEQNKFLEGLHRVEGYTSKHLGKSFLQCSDAEKNSVLNYFSEKDVYATDIMNKINNKLFGKSFFVHLKQLAIEGYCQSEVGATQGLCYDYVPVNYEPCIPLKFNQKSWATK